MHRTLSRRSFVGAAVTSLVGLAVTKGSAGQAGESPLKRKFTMSLSCGAIGVGASPREAIDLAQRFGFEAVEPSPDFLIRLPDEGLAELLAEIKAKKLV